ncbi:MAG TPA: hypothetical protein VF223_14025 [Trebonia sp.]|jgi:hypothetical protein
MWTTREEAMEAAERWRDYLAHFNANRAIYSAEPPPAEQATSR